VIEHATWNGAKLLGLERSHRQSPRRVIADLLIVNGNPLENLKLLNPYGATSCCSTDAGANYGAARGGRPSCRAGRARHRVDDQGRHSVSRADADARGQGHGLARPRPARAHDSGTVASGNLGNRVIG